MAADDGPGDGRAGPWRSVLVDVAGMSLAELAAALPADDESALAQCLRRVADGLDEPGEPIAGFNSAL